MTLMMPGCCVKKSMTAAGFLGRGQQIDVADDFLAPPQAARRAATNHVGMRAQIVQNRLGRRPARRPANGARRIGGGNWMPCKILACVFSPKPSSSATFPSWQAFSNCSTVSTPSLSLSALTFFGPKPWNVQHAPPAPAGWKPSVPRNRPACRFAAVRRFFRAGCRRCL